MDSVLSFVMGSLWLVFLIGLVLTAGVVYTLRYKTASANEVLVVSGGGKGLKTYIAGGAFVGPKRRAQFFSLETKTVRSNDQETHSSTLVPVVVKWTAQLKPDSENKDALNKAIEGFISYDSDEDIINSLQQTLDGEVRAVVATMTPEDVVRDKDGFSTQVTQNVQKRMTELGYKLISLNISEVTDRNGHYHNLATQDREVRRRESENFTAAANRDVSVTKAKADEESRAAELSRDLAVAEKQREVTLRTAAIRSETDLVTTDAEYAGQLQAEDRKKDLAVRQGEVQVVEQQQAEASATARRAVEMANAETMKQTRAVQAQSEKEQAEIAAASKARKDEIAAESAANVAKRNADGEAVAAKSRAQGEADAINLTTEAKADEVRKTGLAQAEVTRANGEAEAASTLAKGRAEAEVQREMAEALAANDGANLRVTLAEIERDTKITVYTAVGTAMAKVGEKATFIDMGGKSAGDGDLLSGVLANVPELLKQLDVKSQALLGTSIGEGLGSFIPSKGSDQSSSEVNPASSLGDASTIDGVSVDASVDGVDETSHEELPVIPEVTPADISDEHDDEDVDGEEPTGAFGPHEQEDDLGNSGDVTRE